MSPKPNFNTDDFELVEEGTGDSGVWDDYDEFSDQGAAAEGFEDGVESRGRGGRSWQNENNWEGREGRRGRGNGRMGRATGDGSWDDNYSNNSYEEWRDGGRDEGGGWGGGRSSFGQEDEEGSGAGRETIGR
ncbi:unnamed protein product, partial [Discosporangium mesarthrocarpum]